MLLPVGCIVTLSLLVPLFLHFSLVDGARSRTKQQRQSVEEIRATLHEYTSTGRMNDVIAYLDKVESSYGTLLIDDVIPSLYSYKAIALYNALKVEEAEKMLKIAVHHYPKDTRSWINLGEMQVQTFKLDEAYRSFSAALKAEDLSALPRALRTKGWATSWQDFESLSYSLEREVGLCLGSMQDCRVDSAGGLEYCDVDGRAHVLMNALNPNSISATMVPPASVAPLWVESPNSTQRTVASREKKEDRRLKVGFMSADFGVHPVAQLVRGLFQMVNTSRIEVFCFSLQPKMSWWGQNISETVEHFVWLQNMNTFDAAAEIARLGVEVLIDLNGHTMHSGLTIMAHRPSPVQMSFLGLPTTTAASFVDYYVADSVAVPPEQSKQYSEQLLLMSDCYIANDYAQIQGDVLKFNGEHRAPRSALGGDVDLTKATFLFATLSNSQKMDPEIFHVWMNILQRFAGSKMVITEHAGKDVYVPHLQARARGFGVQTDRLVSLKQAPWIDHLYAKTAIDLVLDTIAKNGHTTGLDGIWAGIPTLSLAGGQEAPRRAAESIAVTLDSTLGLAYSLKEYEDLAFALARKKRSKFVQERAEKRKKAKNSPANPSEEEQALLHSAGKFKKSSGLGASTGDRLGLWRKHVGSQRTVSNLFDMPQYEENFSRLLQGSWELAHIAEIKKAFRNTTARGIVSSKKKGFVLNNVAFNPKGLFHMFTPVGDRYRQDRDTSSGGRKSQINFEEVPTSSPLEPARRWNRDSRGRIVVAQTAETEGTMIAEAVKRLPSEADDAPASHHNFDKMKKSARRSSSAAAGEASEDAGVQTDPAKRNARMEQRSGGRGPKKYPPLPSYIFDGRLIMLNIGGTKPEEGWLTVNAQPEGTVLREHAVDVQRDMHDLHGLKNNSVSAIYTSHTLEHNSFGDNALETTLAEWYRVLRPGGLLMVSVPNLQALARMYLDPSFTLQDQWMVTKMMYGAQSDEFDYHMVGFNFGILSHFLEAAGFCQIERVQSFQLFQDTSELVYKGYFVSLNVAAKVCADGTPGGKLRKGTKPDDGFDVNHNGTPFEGE